MAKADPKTELAVQTKSRLDFNNIEVKRMITKAKKSGLLTTEDLNKHL